jgi:hypothetical protein
MMEPVVTQLQAHKRYGRYITSNRYKTSSGSNGDFEELAKRQSSNTVHRAQQCDEKAGLN